MEREGHAPERPTLTVVFISAVLFWAACALAYSTGAARVGAEARVALMAMGAAVIGSLPLFISEKARFAGLVVASLAVGGLLGCSQASFVHACSDSLEGLAGQRVELKLLEDSVDYGFGETALVEASVGGAAPAAFTARLGDCGPLLAGQRVSALATFKPIDYAEDSYAWNDGACGQLTANSVEIVPAPQPMGALLSLRARAIDAIGAEDEGHALLQALVCGYRRNVRGTELYTEFQTCGLAHVVAVSGAHLVIVTGLFASLLKRLHAPRRASIAVLIGSMLVYYVIAGMPVSALRAVIMSTLGLLSYFGKRRPSSLNAVGVGLFAIIVASPAASVSASLALSALSTVGIVLFAPLAQSWLERTPLASLPFALDALSLTLSASMLSQLYACSLFDQLPLVAPVANVVSAPLFPIVCGLGLAAGLGQAVLGAAGALGQVAVLPAGLLAGLVGLLAHMPFASVPFTMETHVALGLSCLLALGLWAWWPQPGKHVHVTAGAAVLCAAAVVAIAFAFPLGQGDRIVMLDVGQGDAILVQSRGKSMLIDTGNKDSKLQHELAVNRVAHLDSVLVTHADDDHCGSLDQLERTVEVDRVIVAQDMISCDGASARALVEQAHKTAREVVGVRLGDTFNVGAFSVRVVWPRSFTEEGGNADSLCVVLDYDGDDDGLIDCTALMTGDAEKDELAEMLERGLVGDVDILKVGHHGSRNGMTPDEVDALAPEVSLISCGLHNRYGHPTQEILGMLEAASSAVYRTDLDGEVTCALTPDSISVTCSGATTN